MTGGVFEDAALRVNTQLWNGPVTQEYNVPPDFPDGLCLGDILRTDAIFSRSDMQ